MAKKTKAKDTKCILKREAKTSWSSIYVATALSFVGAIQFSLYFSSMWQYLKIIDPSITEKFYGYIIAIYSVGQIISAPSFGYWSNVIRQVRLPLQIGLVMMFIGNAIYITLQQFEPILPARYLLLAARLIIGIGSGNSSLLRSYASTASTAHDRSKAIAYVTCGQAIGQVAGPAFQLMFTPMSYPGVHLIGEFCMNMYTAPAYFACLMNLIGSWALIYYFKEEYVGIEDEESDAETESIQAKTATDEKGFVEVVLEEGRLAPSTNTTNASAVTRCDSAYSSESGRTSPEDGDEQQVLKQSESAKKAKRIGKNKGKDKGKGAADGKRLPPYDFLATFVCYVTRFTQMFIQVNLETIGGPFAMMMFAWNEETAVKATSAAQGAVGFLTFAFFIVYIVFRVDKLLNFRFSNIVAVTALITFHVLTYSWPFLPTTVHSFDNTSTQAEHLGCDAAQFAWCGTLSQVNVYVYYAAYVLLIGSAFPVLNIAMPTLFSYVLGPRRQGTQQGVLQMSGGVARMLGPILMGNLYTTYGPTMAWNMELLVCGVTLALWLIFYRRMVPLVECSDTEMTTTTNMNGGGGSGSLRQHLTRSTSKVFDINGVKQPANAIVAEANAVAANTRALARTLDRILLEKSQSVPVMFIEHGEIDLMNNRNSARVSGRNKNYNNKGVNDAAKIENGAKIGVSVNENNSAGNGSIIAKTFVQRIGSTRKGGHAPAAFAALLPLRASTSPITATTTENDVQEASGNTSNSNAVQQQHQKQCSFDSSTSSLPPMLLKVS